LSANTSGNWFTEVVEPLADRFDPAAVDEYVRLFSEVLASADPRWSAGALRSRYERVRRPRTFAGPDPERVYVLSRVTLGADVAITSLALDAMKRRFPHARIFLTGSRKAWELFAADSRVEHAPAPYNRTGSLEERLAATRALETILNHPRAIVIDPDSRLTQLGVAPVCREDAYYFFESRASRESGTLGQLFARWLDATFGTPEARAYIAPHPFPEAPADIAVSLGVGENPNKRIPDPFERRLLETLSETGCSILIDKGPGGEETARVERAISGLSNVRAWTGAFAPFAAAISRSRLYVGYDSAGQHVAAAAGAPLITVFAGFPNERFLERWRPAGAGPIEIIRADDRNPHAALDAVRAALRRRRWRVAG
jgi:ADP-heptose:LPS heptosyltransferase